MTGWTWFASTSALNTGTGIVEKREVYSLSLLDRSNLLIISLASSLAASISASYIYTSVSVTASDLVDLSDRGLEGLAFTD